MGWIRNRDGERVAPVEWSFCRNLDTVILLVQVSIKGPIKYRYPGSRKSTLFMQSLASLARTSEVGSASTILCLQGNPRSHLQCEAAGDHLCSRVEEPELRSAESRRPAVAEANASEQCLPEHFPETTGLSGFPVCFSWWSGIPSSTAEIPFHLEPAEGRTPGSSGALAPPRG